MQGILFGDKHSYRDFGLSLVEAPFVDPAEPNINLLEIDGGNGFINLSEVLTGETTYKTRKHTWKFKTNAKRNDWGVLLQKLYAYVHGKELKIILDELPWGYYEGVCSVGSPTVKDNWLYVDISASLQPFLYDNNLTTLSESWTATETRGISLGGKLASSSYWNTLYRYGTDKFPELNISALSNIVITYDVPRGSKLWMTNRSVQVWIVGSQSGAYSTTFTVPASSTHKFIKKIPVSDIYSGIETYDIFKIEVDYMSGARVSGEIEGHFVQCGNGSVSVLPVIQSSSSGTVSSGTVSEIYKSGLYSCENVKIEPGGSELVFKNSSGDAIISYRKAWL